MKFKQTIKAWAGAKELWSTTKETSSTTLKPTDSAKTLAYTVKQDRTETQTGKFKTSFQT